MLDELGLGAASKVLRVARGWASWVGPEIAAHCRPLALRGELLELEVESSPEAQELQFRVPEMLDALRRELGAEAPSAIRFRVVGTPRPDRDGTGPRVGGAGPRW